MPADPSPLDLAALTAEAERLGYVRRTVGRGGFWGLADNLLTRATVGRCSNGAWYADTSCYVDEQRALVALLGSWEGRSLAAIVDAAEARGREAERAAVVAWLRLRAARMMPDFADVVEHLTDIIARGGHRAD